jgi:hypothetical protein
MTRIRNSRSLRLDYTLPSRFWVSEFWVKQHAYLLDMVSIGVQLNKVYRIIEHDDELSFI